MTAIDLDEIESMQRAGVFSNDDARAMAEHIHLLHVLVERMCGCAPDCAERMTCDRGGEVGHSQCGWCAEHEKPLHKCSHFAEATS